MRWWWIPDSNIHLRFPFCLRHYSIPNFWPDTYGHKSHCMWCCFVILFCILGIRPHCTWEWWFVWYIGRKPNAHVLCIWVHVLGVDPEAHNWWDVCVVWEALKKMSIWCLCWARGSGAHEYLMFVLIERLWSTWVFDVCVEQEALEHMSIYIVLSMKLWSTWKIKIESFGHNTWSLPSWCWA